MAQAYRTAATPDLTALGCWEALVNYSAQSPQSSSWAQQVLSGIITIIVIMHLLQLERPPITENAC